MSGYRITEPLGQAVEGRRLSYRGDIAADIIGQIVGPNTFGESWVIVSAVYDRATDRTLANLRVCREPDLRSAVRL